MNDNTELIAEANLHNWGSELSDYELPNRLIQALEVADRDRAELRERLDDREGRLSAIAKAMTVAYPGPEDTPADYMRAAARNLEGHYEVGGSNLRAAVVRVLRAVAALSEPSTPSVGEPETSAGSVGSGEYRSSPGNSRATERRATEAERRTPPLMPGPAGPTRSVHPVTPETEQGDKR